MSPDDNSNTDDDGEGLPGGHRVDDDEDESESKIIRRILNSRERVDKAEREIFVKAATDPSVTISLNEQVATWGVIVKQYVRNVEPLLRADEIDDSDAFYEEIELGKVTVVPPEQGDRDFSLVQYQGLTDAEIKDMLRLPLSATLPSPQTTRITGLREIIELPQVITETWRVQVDDGIETDVETLHGSQAISKEVYTEAVRRTDEFLQQAGIGIQTAPEGVPKFGFKEVGNVE